MGASSLVVINRSLNHVVFVFIYSVMHVVISMIN